MFYKEKLTKITITTTRKRWIGCSIRVERKNIAFDPTHGRNSSCQIGITYFRILVSSLLCSVRKTNLWVVGLIQQRCNWIYNNEYTTCIITIPVEIHSQPHLHDPVRRTSIWEIILEFFTRSSSKDHYLRTEAN